MSKKFEVLIKSFKKLHFNQDYSLVKPRVKPKKLIYKTFTGNYFTYIAKLCFFMHVKSKRNKRFYQYISAL